MPGISQRGAQIDHFIAGGDRSRARGPDGLNLAIANEQHTVVDHLRAFKRDRQDLGCLERETRTALLTGLGRQLATHDHGVCTLQLLSGRARGKAGQCECTQCEGAHDAQRTTQGKADHQRTS